MQLQYRPNSQSPWRDAPAQNQLAWRGSEANGELKWKPEQPGGPLQLRVVATDAAGNQGEAVRQVLAANVPAAELADAVPPTPPAPLPPRSNPGATASSPPVLGQRLRQWAGAIAPGLLTDVAGTSPASPTARAAANPVANPPSTVDPYAGVLPQENWRQGAQGPAANETNAARPHPAAVASAAPAGPNAGPANPAPMYDPGSFRSVRHRDQRASAAASADSRSGQASTASGDRGANERSVLIEPPAAGPMTATQARPLTAKDAEPLLVNTRQFALDYELHDIQADAIAEVQLWATDDGGAHWAQWGTDQDHASPVEVQVRQEGVFGFRVVVSHRNGFSSRPPINGDPADIWVQVDSTAPVVSLTSAVYGSGLTAGQIDIQWQASDPLLTPRPVSLYYSGSATGPWTPIERGLANTGAYQWRVPPSITSEFFLRIEVKDRAGNRSEHQLEQPIRIEGLLPRARIRAVRE